MVAPRWLQVDSVFATLGRGVLCCLAALMPLAFCRESMYVFQLKTLLLQYGGMVLLALILCRIGLLLVGQSLRGARFESSDSSEGRPELAQLAEMFSRPVVMLLLAFLLWQCAKSWDSIAPTLSWREMSRVFWLPVVALSVPVFFVQKQHLFMLVKAVVWSAVLTFAFALAMYEPTLRVLFFESDELWMDLMDSPLASGLKSLFYPEAFADIFSKKSELKALKGEAILPIRASSFFPGKAEAGSFGNKNFLAAYLNMTWPLMLWLAWRHVVACRAWWRQQNVRRTLFSLLVSAVLLLSVLAIWYHLVRLENRGSWLGWLGAVFLVGCVFLWYGLSSAWRWRGLALMFVLMAVGAFSVHRLSPDRFESIFSVEHGSNELRRLIWSAYAEAWWDDGEWPGAESDVKRRLTGFGNYSFRVVYPKVRSPRIFKIEYNHHNTETSHPHNEYLGLLGELGLVGLALYLAWMFAMSRGALSWVKQASANLMRRKEARGTVLDDEPLKDAALKDAALKDAALLFLLGAVMVAVLSQWIHQGVSVAVRYTGAGFQLWLSVGLLLFFVLRRGSRQCAERQVASAVAESPLLNTSRATHGGGLAGLLASGLLLLCLAWVSTPSLLWPIHWFQSQHFFEMGQIYYASVRQYQLQWSSVNREAQSLRSDLSQKQALSSAEVNLKSKALKSKEDLLARIHKAMSFYQSLANRYFESGHQHDPAHVESLYIGANMSVQLGNRALAMGRYDLSRSYYRYAIGCYQKIEKEWPYFVQLHYWKGVCWKGLGVVQKSLKNEALSKEHFRRALDAYERYELQDPHYKDLFLDRYLCHSYLGDNEAATVALVDFLLNIEEAGEALFSETRRYDSRYILSVLAQSGVGVSLEMAQRLYRRLLDYEVSTCLLPFVPKTDRHIKNSFRWLQEQK